MKKVFLTLLMIVGIISLTACGNANNNADIIKNDGPIEYITISDKRIDFPQNVGSLISQLENYDFNVTSENIKIGARQPYTTNVSAALGSTNYNFTLMGTNHIDSDIPLGEAKVKEFNILLNDGLNEIVIHTKNGSFKLGDTRENVIKILGNDYSESDTIAGTTNTIILRYTYNINNLVDYEIHLTEGMAYNIKIMF